MKIVHILYSFHQVVVSCTVPLDEREHSACGKSDSHFDTLGHHKVIR